MIKTVIVLPDGRQISSGTPAQAAIAGCTVTEAVNSGTELTLGAVCAAMAEVKLLLPEGEIPITAGDEVTVFQETAEGRRQVGIFTAEKPVRTGRHTATVTAYDRVTALDRDLTDWLAALEDWPYSLQSLAEQVCTACGLVLETAQIPGGSFPVEKFSAGDITGRKLMQAIAEVSGCFCRATAAGTLEFAWYVPAEEGIGPKATATAWQYDAGVLTVTDPDVTADYEAGTVEITAPHWRVDTSEGLDLLTAARQYYFSGSLSYGDYAVAPIEKVQLRQSEEDLGAIYPDDPAQTNTYRITGNPLLAGAGKQALEGLAQRLYERLRTVTYTPCRVTVPADTDIRAGQILSVTDPEGRQLSAYIMQCRRTGQQLMLECTGSQCRDSVTAVNEQSYKALSGKVLALRTDIDGIRAENKAADGRVGLLELSVEGLSAQTRKQTAEADALRTQLIKLQQTADSVQIDVRSIREQGASRVQTGTGYTFDDKGLKIAREGAQIENLLDNTGMYVTRGGDVVLQAGSEGVAAADVTVRSYLRVGHSRLEGYENSRTACFYIGTGG